MALEQTLTPDVLDIHDVFAAAAPHAVDGFYGVLPPRSDRIIAEIAQHPEFLELQSLFSHALQHLDPANATEVQVRLEAFPSLRVICVVRGKVDRVISVLAYAQDSGHFLPRETSLPNGC